MDKHSLNLNTSFKDQNQKERLTCEIIVEIDNMLARLPQTPEMRRMRRQLFRVFNYIFGLDIDDYTGREGGGVQ